MSINIALCRVTPSQKGSSKRLKDLVQAVKQRLVPWAGDSKGQKRGTDQPLQESNLAEKRNCPVPLPLRLVSREMGRSRLHLVSAGTSGIRRLFHRPHQRAMTKNQNIYTFNVLPRPWHCLLSLLVRKFQQTHNTIHMPLRRVASLPLSDTSVKETPSLT